MPAHVPGKGDEWDIILSLNANFGKQNTKNILSDAGQHMPCSKYVTQTKAVLESEG